MIHESRSSKKYRNINSLKNRLADNRLSVFDFYLEYFRAYKVMQYPEFLDLINVNTTVTDELRMAIDDFWAATE